MWLYSSLWILKRCASDGRVLRRFTGGCGTAGVAAPALPGCSRRWESRARRGWALPPGEAPGTPKPDSVHPDGMCLRGRAGSGGAAPGWEGNKILDQKARGDPRSGATGSAPCSAFCYLHLIIWLKSECNPFTAGFCSRKGTFWTVREGDWASHLLGSLPDGTAGHCRSAHTTWIRLVMPQFAHSWWQLPDLKL